MKTLQLDLHHSLRTLRKNPGYAAIVILLLALGIGANTAIFSVANSVLLRPLSYAHPERLVVTLHQGNAPVSPADYLDYKKSVRAFEQMGAAEVWGGTLYGSERRGAREHRRGRPRRDPVRSDRCGSGAVARVDGGS